MDSDIEISPCPKCDTLPIFEGRDIDNKIEGKCHGCGWASGFPDSDKMEALANWNIMAKGYVKFELDPDRLIESPWIQSVEDLTSKKKLIYKLKNGNKVYVEISHKDIYEPEGLKAFKLIDAIESLRQKVELLGG